MNRKTPITECCDAEIEIMDLDSAPHCKSCLKKCHVDGRTPEITKN